MVFHINGLDEEFVRIPALGDGSCMFHAILQAFNKTYIESNNREKQRIVRQVRNDLSDILDKKIGDRVCYDQLSRGSLKTFAKYVPEASLKNMKRSLAGNDWGDYRFLELLSNIFEIDIYIIDRDKGDLYNTGDTELFYKNRDSIIILNNSNFHFDTVGVKTKNGIRTLFDHNEPLVTKLQSKLYKGQ